MKSFPQIELTSQDRLLTRMGLAIEETKLVKSIIESKNIARKLETDNPFSRQLISMNREIRYLEARLIKVRIKADRACKEFSQGEA